MVIKYSVHLTYSLKDLYPKHNDLDFHTLTSTCCDKKPNKTILTTLTYYKICKMIRNVGSPKPLIGIR